MASFHWKKYDHLTTTDGFCWVAGGQPARWLRAKSSWVLKPNPKVLWIDWPPVMRCEPSKVGGFWGPKKTTWVSVDAQFLRIQTLQKYTIIGEIYRNLSKNIWIQRAMIVICFLFVVPFFFVGALGSKNSYSIVWEGCFLRFIFGWLLYRASPLW